MIIKITFRSWCTYYWLITPPLINILPWNWLNDILKHFPLTLLKKIFLAPDPLYTDKENICKESRCKNCGVCESRLTGPFLLIGLRIPIQIDRIRPSRKSQIMTLKKNSIKIRPLRKNWIRNKLEYGSDLKNSVLDISNLIFTDENCLKELKNKISAYFIINVDRHWFFLFKFRFRADQDSTLQKNQIRIRAYEKQVPDPSKIPGSATLMTGFAASENHNYAN